MNQGRNMKLLHDTSVVLIISALGAAHAIADNGSPFSGQYRVVGNGACTESTIGFTDRPALQPLGAVVSYQEAFTGTIMFDSVGNALQRIRGMTMFDGPFFPNNSAVGGFDGTCNFTYSLAGDQSFTLTGTCSGTLTDGPAAGQTYSNTGVFLEGQISRDSDQISLANAVPLEQGIVLSGGYSARRYCISSSTLMRSSKK
jgi:hypothetical protein